MKNQDFQLCAEGGAQDAIKAGRFRFTHLAGRCRSGNDTTGKVVHTLVDGIALCGKQPGLRSAGWSEYNDRFLSCKKCKAEFEKLSPNKWRCLSCNTEHESRANAVECCPQILEVIGYTRNLCKVAGQLKQTLADT